MERERESEIESERERERQRQRHRAHYLTPLQTVLRWGRTQDMSCNRDSAVLMLHRELCKCCQPCMPFNEPTFKPILAYLLSSPNHQSSTLHLQFLLKCFFRHFRIISVQS